MTLVKICGVTRPADAELATEFGAAAVGMILWSGSPRAVEVALAKEIAATVGSRALRVGVFVDIQADAAHEIAETVGLDVIQLHDAGPIPAAWSVSGPRIFKLVAGHDDVEAWPGHITPLIDAVDSQKRGGTGRVADWHQAAALARRRDIILAGGLTSDNVADAIRNVRPWAVDVSSGVEDRPGIKSAARMRDFFAAVAAATERTP